MAENQRKNEGKIFQLLIRIEHTDPPIWRRLLFPEWATFNVLHWSINKCMMWRKWNTHYFLAGKDGSLTIGDPFVLEQSGISDDTVPEWDTALQSFLIRVGDSARYFFGSEFEWELSVTLEKILPPEEGRSYPCCIDGALFAPVEDIGGAEGHKKLRADLEKFGEDEQDDLVSCYRHIDFDYFSPVDICLPDITAPDYEISDWFEDEDYMPEAPDYLGLDKETVMRLLSGSPEDLSDLVVFHFDRIAPETLKETNIVQMVLLLIGRFRESGNTLCLTAAGYFTPAMVKEFVRKIMINFDEHRTYQEKQIPLVRMLHCFLLKHEYVEEVGGFCALKKPDEWQELSDELIRRLYRELFLFLLDTYPLTSMTESAEFQNPEYGLIQQSILFSLYLLNQEASAFISGKDLFSHFVKAFPEFSLIWFDELELQQDLFGNDIGVYEEIPEYMLYTRIFLHEFCVSLGVLDIGVEKDLAASAGDELKGLDLLMNSSYRVTSLYDDLIEWKI